MQLAQTAFEREPRLKAFFSQKKNPKHQRLVSRMFSQKTGPTSLNPLSQKKELKLGFLCPITSVLH